MQRRQAFPREAPTPEEARALQQLRRPTGNQTPAQAEAIVSNRVSQFASHSVALTTHKQYMSHINTLRSGSDELGAIPATHFGLSRFLSLPGTSGRVSGRTAEGMRSAVNYFCEITATPKDDADVAQLDRVVTAFKRLNPRRGPEKGAIGLEQIQEVVGMLREEGYADKAIIYGFIMQFAFGLRPNQVATLGHGQFSLLADGSYLYLGDRVKVKVKDTSDTGTSREMHYCDPRMHDNVRAILAKYAGGDRNKPMFPSYGKVKERNDIVKRAAKKFGWDPKVDWSGAHCVRHGALMDAREQGGLPEVERRGAHRSEAMWRLYSRTMEVRRAPERRARSETTRERRQLIHPPATAVRQARR